MSIRHLSYLACDECLRICDDSDGDTAAEARRVGKRSGWIRRDRRDLCPQCQGWQPCCAAGCARKAVSVLRDAYGNERPLCERHGGADG